MKHFTLLEAKNWRSDYRAILKHLDILKRKYFIPNGLDIPMRDPHPPLGFEHRPLQLPSDFDMFVATLLKTLPPMLEDALETRILESDLISDEMKWMLHQVPPGEGPIEIDFGEEVDEELKDTKNTTMLITIIKILKTTNPSLLEWIVKQLFTYRIFRPNSALALRDQFNFHRAVQRGEVPDSVLRRLATGVPGSEEQYVIQHYMTNYIWLEKIIIRSMNSFVKILRNENTVKQMLKKQDPSNGYNGDIMRWIVHFETLPELQKFAKSIPMTRKQQVKMLKKWQKSSENVIPGADLVINEQINSNTILQVFHIQSWNAAVYYARYYGSTTGAWCIAATKIRKFYNDWANKTEIYYFIENMGNGQKWAVFYDKNTYEPILIADSDNNEYYLKDIGFLSPTAIIDRSYYDNFKYNDYAEKIHHGEIR